MNKLVATWRCGADVDLDELDVADLLTRAHDYLVGVPGLSHAAHLVEIALDDALAWFDGDVGLRPVRSISSSGSR